MNSSVSVAAPGSRPKIHKLPKLPPKPQPRRAVPGFLLFWAGIFVALLATAVALQHSGEPQIALIGSQSSPKTVSVPVNAPLVAVTPQININASSTNTKVDAETAAENAGGLVSSIQPFSDAQAASASSNLKPSQTIVLQGNAELIVGQMAKIPAESEQITEVKPLSVIDNHAGTKLLSIISKY